MNAGSIGSDRARTVVQARWRVRLTEAPFPGIEGIYQMADGECRVMVLIEILSKSVAVRVTPASLRKAS